MTEQIKPWSHVNTQDNLYVPSYIEDMAQQVLQFYDLTVHQKTVVTTKNKSGGAIWKLVTDKGNFSLKLLHRKPERSKFSLGAQEYLVHEKKARIPTIFKTKEGEAYVEMGGKLWFVAEWIETLHELPQNLDGAKKLCYALGEFHKLSRGYIPPDGAETVSRLDKWPRNYERIEKKLGWFRDIAMAYSEMPASSLIISVIDMYQEQANQSLAWLENSSYQEIVSKGTQVAGLVHQDYGWSNAQMADDGVWVIDLDSVSYDITIRDLRKLIVDCMRMDSLGKWDINWVKKMILAYHQANPITDEVYEMLLIDLSLPDLFYNKLKNIVYSPTTFMTYELEQKLQLIIELDKQKWEVLAELAKDQIGGF